MMTPEPCVEWRLQDMPESSKSKWSLWTFKLRLHLHLFIWQMIWSKATYKLDAIQGTVDQGEVYEPQHLILKREKDRERDWEKGTRWVSTGQVGFQSIFEDRLKNTARVYNPINPFILPQKNLMSYIQLYIHFTNYCNSHIEHWTSLLKHISWCANRLYKAPHTPVQTE